MKAYSTIGGEISIELNLNELPLNGRLRIRDEKQVYDSRIEVQRYTGNQFITLETFPEEAIITEITLFRISLSDEAYNELKRRDYVGERFSFGWRIDINLI